MKNMKDPRTKIVPSQTRGGKELPSSSALDSPFGLNRLATPPSHAINPDMSQVTGDSTSAMNDAYDDASTFIDDTVPLGEFLDEQLARAKEIEHAEIGDTIETDEVFATQNIEIPLSHDYPRTKMTKIPEVYVMDEEIAGDSLACKDRDGLNKLLCKLKEKSWNTKIKYDPKFATLPIFVSDKDYEFSINP
ncbi:hypothetical protein D1007_02353 [Hordeum vulgare]|nr:hypothetical protein D1007_02353 [Hordeum vulgare]